MTHSCASPSLQSERYDIKLVLLSVARSLQNFEEVTKVFLTQYASCQEAKKNNYHLLSVKIRQSDSLKSYISFFQSQLAKVPNRGEDVSVLAFISGLQILTLVQAHPQA